MIDLRAPWIEWPRVAVSMNPVKGVSDDFVWFCDLAIARQDPGRKPSVVSWRIRNEGRAFKASEAILYQTVGCDSGYLRQAVLFREIVPEIQLYARDALPIAVSPKICRPLLHAEVRRVERQMKERVDRSGVFLIREASRWLDLGFLRLKGRVLPMFGGTSVPIVERVEEALRRVDSITKAMGADPTIGVPALLDWQDDLRRDPNRSGAKP